MTVWQAGRRLTPTSARVGEVTRGQTSMAIMKDREKKRMVQSSWSTVTMKEVKRGCRGSRTPTRQFRQRARDRGCVAVAAPGTPECRRNKYCLGAPGTA